MIAALLLAGALAGPGQDANLPAMHVRQDSAYSYVVEIDRFDSDLAAPVQDAMKQLAATKCGARTMRWGKFTFSREPSERAGHMDIVDFHQGFRCIDPATDPYKPVPADWKPSERDARNAVAFTASFLELLRVGDMAAVRARSDPSLELTADQIRPALDILKYAPVGMPQITINGWANNFDGAPHPGAYVLLDFKGVSYCGSLMLYRRDDGSFEMVQQNVNGIKEPWTGSVEQRQALKQYCPAS